MIRNPQEKYPKQQGTDYRYVTQLARRAVTCSTSILDQKPGMSLAYWGPEFAAFYRQPAAEHQHGCGHELDSLNFSYNGLAATQYIATILEPNSKFPIPIPIPSIDSSKQSLFGKRRRHTLKSKVIPDLASKSFAEAAYS